MSLSSIFHAVEDTASKAIHLIMPAGKSIEDAVASLAQSVVGPLNWTSITDQVKHLETTGLASLEKKSTLVTHVAALLPQGTSDAVINWLAETAVSVVKSSLSSVFNKLGTGNAAQ